jgi:hypothetical protein
MSMVILGRLVDLDLRLDSHPNLVAYGWQAPPCSLRDSAGTHRKQTAGRYLLACTCANVERGQAYLIVALTALIDAVILPLP